jgi:hypothetical protein
MVEIEREKNHPDFALMDVLDKNHELAGAVLAVGKRAREDGYRQGWHARGNHNTIEMYFGFVMCALLGALVVAAIATFV